MNEPRTIIVDGPDGSGKTVLSKNLQKNFNFGYVHEKGDLPHLNEDGALLGYYIAQIQNGGIVDRSILSEIVFGPLLRKKCRTNDMASVMVELEKQEGVYVVSLPPPEMCMVHWADRQKKGQEFINDPQEFMWSYARFSYFANQYSHFERFIIYDYTVMGYDELIEAIMLV